MSWLIPPEWTGETAFIIGGGPSLKNVSRKLERVLYGRGRVLAVNRAYRIVPNADCLYGCDRKFWQRHWGHIQHTFTGRYMVTSSDWRGPKQIRLTGDNGLEVDPIGVRSGKNSGYQAINLAYHFGAARIVLLGFDMKCEDGRTHWHEGYGETEAGYRSVLEDCMLPNFTTLVEPLKAMGVEVINSTPDSALRCWKYVPLIEVLNG